MSEEHTQGSSLFLSFPQYLGLQHKGSSKQQVQDILEIVVLYSCHGVHHCWWEVGQEVRL